MSWDEAPPSKDELKGASWDSAPPTPEELHGASGAFDLAKRSAQGIETLAHEMFPFYQGISNAGAGARAAVQTGADQFRDSENRKSFVQHYTENQNENTAEDKRRMDAAPAAAKVVGTAAGIVPSLEMAPFAETPGALGVGARMGAQGAMAAGEAATRDQDPLKAGAVGAGLQGGAEAVFGGAGKLADKAGLTDYLDRLAGERAAKAAVGQNIKGYRQLAQNQGVDGVAKKGAMLMETDKYGPPVVGPFTNTKLAGERAQDKATQVGNEFGTIGQKIDAIAPYSVSGHEIADNILKWGQQNFDPRLKSDQAMMKQLASVAEDYQNIGAMSFAEAQAFRNKYKPPAFNHPPTSFVERADIQPMLKQSIGEAMSSAADRVSQLPGGEQIAQEYGDIKKAYGVYKPIANMAKDRELRNASNRWVSPTDNAAGMASGVGAVVKGATAGHVGMAAVAGAVANKQARTRGAAFTARSAKMVADMLRDDPAKLGQFASPLRAALARGGAAFEATHALLLQKDPNYAALFDDAAPEENP